MVGMEITLPKGWTTQKITRQRDRRIGQLNGLHENNSPMDGRHKNNSSKRWTDGELYGRHKNKTHQRMEN